MKSSKKDVVVISNKSNFGVENGVLRLVGFNIHLNRTDDTMDVFMGLIDEDLQYYNCDGRKYDKDYEGFSNELRDLKIILPSDIESIDESAFQLFSRDPRIQITIVAPKKFKSKVSEILKKNNLKFKVKTKEPGLFQKLFNRNENEKALNV